MNFSKYSALAGIVACGAMLVSCLGGGGGSGLSGSSQSGAASLSSISDLPDTSQMIVTSESGAAALRFAVSGTPPKLNAITPTSALETFWPGLDLDAIVSDPSVIDADDASGACFNFWGSEENADAPGGFGACFMAQQVGYSFENILQSGGSFCYMKNLPAATDPSDVTARGDNPSLADPNTIFEQQTEDRIVAVNVTGEGPGGGEGDEEEREDQTVYIRVHGSNSVGTGSYRVTLWFCGDESGLDGYEEITVNKNSGQMTANSAHDDDFGASTIEVIGFLKENSDGSISFDENADRLASMAWNWSEGDNSGSFKTQLEITNENRIYSKTFETQSFQTGEGQQTDGRKAYSVSEFQFAEGDDQKVGNIQFLQAAVKDVPTDDSYREDGGFNAAVEYRDDGYYSAPDSSLRSLLSAVNFDTDSFYANSPTVTVNLSEDDYPCSGVDVDYEVAMDFSDPDIAAVGERCESDRLEEMNFCWSSQIRQVEDAIFDQCSFDGP